MCFRNAYLEIHFIVLAIQIHDNKQELVVLALFSILCLEDDEDSILNTLHTQPLLSTSLVSPTSILVTEIFARVCCNNPLLHKFGFLLIFEIFPKTPLIVYWLIGIVFQHPSWFWNRNFWQMLLLHHAMQ